MLGELFYSTLVAVSGSKLSYFFPSSLVELVTLTKHPLTTMLLLLQNLLFWKGREFKCFCGWYNLMNKMTINLRQYAY